MMLILLFVISFCAFLGLLVSATALDGEVPLCVSDCYYSYKNHGNGWIHCLLLSISAFTLLPVLLELVPEHYEWSSFLCVSGLLAVACAPNYRESFVGSVHKYGAILCAVSAVVWITLGCHRIYMLELNMFIFGLALLFDGKRYLLYGELCMFLSVYVYVFLLLFE